MSKLTDFYAHKAALIEKGEPIDPQWEQLEEQLLKEELLPELTEQLKMVLSKVKSPLMFSGSYDPNGCLSVSFTKNCIITGVQGAAAPTTAAEQRQTGDNTETEEALSDDVDDEAVKALDDAEMSEEYEPIEEAERTTRKGSIGFSVTFPDGTYIHEYEGKDTFIKALQKIGLMRIANGKHKAWHKGYNVVSTLRRVAGKKVQEELDGYFIYTNLSHSQKVKDLNRLSEAFELGLVIAWDDEVEAKLTEESDVTKVSEIIQTAVDGCLAKSRKTNIFALEAIKVIYDLDGLNSIKSYFIRNKLIGVVKEGDFRLNGMFVSCTPEELRTRNTRSSSTRWFETPFVVDNETLYLSNQWVDKEEGSLRFHDLKTMINTCYHGLLDVQKTTVGDYILKEL